MPTRTMWEDLYFVALGVAAADDPSDTYANGTATAGLYAGTRGIASEVTNGILLNDRPMHNPGIEFLTTEKTTGLAQPQTGASGVGVERQIVKKMPTISLGSMGLTPEKLYFFGWGLFQQGVTEGITPNFTKTMIPYVTGSPDCEVWLSFGRSYGDPTDGTAYSMSGAICTQIGISGAIGEQMILSAELVGSTFLTTYNHTASNSTVETTNDFLFTDFVWTFAGTSANVQSFDVQINNNATQTFYNSLVVKSHILQKMTVSGNISLAMSTTTLGDSIQLDNYIAGTDVLLVGTAGSGTKAIVITCNALYTGGEVDPAETELLMNLPFEGVYDGTNHAIQLAVSDGISRSIP